MRTDDSSGAAIAAEPKRDSARAIRLIEKIERRYGLERRSVLPEASLADEQMLVNEALVTKIFQCEQAGAALRESEQKLRRLVAHQVQLKEEERKRVSGEIHDMLGQNLLALRIDVALLQQQTAADPRLRINVKAAMETIDITIRAVRALIADLRPFEIELGLEAAVEWELSRFRRDSGLACHLEMDKRLRDFAFTDEQTLILYRTLQECLSNIALHARATKVDVVLLTQHDSVSMTVADNGVGFFRRHGDHDGFGLLAIRERIASIGGRVSVRSTRTGGATISVSVPIARRHT